MEASNEDRKRAVQERVDTVDKLTPPPEKRAERVFETLRDKHGNEFDTWDLACFCAAYLSFLLPVHPDLEKPVVAIQKYIFNAHYYRGEDLGIFSIPEEIKNAIPKE